MLGVTDLATYTLGAFIIILLPGPNSLYVLSVAARRDRQAGYRAAMGVFLGDTVLITLSAAGVASLELRLGSTSLGLGRSIQAVAVMSMPGVQMPH